MPYFESRTLPATPASAASDRTSAASATAETPARRTAARATETAAAVVAAPPRTAVETSIVIILEAVVVAVVGIVEIHQHDYNILANGQLQPATSSKNRISYQGFSKNRPALKKTAIQIGKVKPVVRNGISTIAYRPTKVSPRRLIIYMRDGNTVYADYDTVGKKLPYYPAIAATMKKAGVVDLQVGAFSYSYGSHDK